MNLLSTPIGVGRTAQVYCWGSGFVVKLYYPGFPSVWIDREYHVSRAVFAAGVPCPSVEGLIEIEGRRGILFERIEGPSLQAAIFNNPWKVFSYAQILARLQAGIHRCSISDLSSQQEELAYSIRSAAKLPEDLREKVLKKLDRLPEGDRLCHGDFHPGNIILSKQGPVIIDWLTAVRGHPAAEIALTRLLLDLQHTYKRGTSRLLVLLARDVFYHSYLRHYQKLDPGVTAQSDEFLAVQAASLMSREIASEHEKMLKLVSQV